MFLWQSNEDEIKKGLYGCGKKATPIFNMIKTIKGDLVKIARETNLFDVYIHGCNCQSIMGRGIAKQIAETFPDVYKIDRFSKLKANQKLGRFTSTTFRNMKYHRIHFINAYTQLTIGSGCQVDYVAIKDSLEAIRTMFGGCQQRFAMPKIGAGLGGGDWNRIKAIIEDVFKHEDVTVIEYDPKL